MERLPLVAPTTVRESVVEWSVSYGLDNWEWFNADGSPFTVRDAEARKRELGGNAKVCSRVVTSIRRTP